MPLTPSEQQELAQLEKEVGSQANMTMRQSKPGLTPEEQAEMQSLEGEVGHLAPQEERPTMLRKGLGAVGKVLDYPGGILRTGIASVGGLLSGKPIVDREDVKQALQGNAPTSAEYLERGGVTPGPNINLPSAEFDVPYFGKIKTPENVSLRDAEGLALDIATDPLTALTKAGKMVRPVGEVAENVGKKVYKSGLKKVDEKLLERGAKPVSDVLLEEGKAGSTKTLQKEARKIGETLGKERTELYKKATDKGVTVDMAHPLPAAEAEIARMRSDPGLAPMADALDETLGRYKAGGRVDVGTLSDWKTNLYSALPATAYDAQGRLSTPAKKFQKALANDFKTAIVDAGNTAEKGLGDKINAINDKWSTIIQADKPLTMQARRANTHNAFTSVDGILAASTAAASHDPITTGLVMAAKKGSDISKTTAARTMTGRGLVNAGRSGLLDAGARQGLIAREKKRRGLIDEDRGLLSGEE